MSDLLANIAQWITEVVYSFGYTGVAVLVALGCLHLPVPTELTLPLAGFLIGQGRFSFVAVMAASTVAAVSASLILYYLGLWIGEERLRRAVKRFERSKLVSESDLDRASRMFERHGGKAILVGHLVPAVGAAISIPAGLNRMPILGRFTFYTVIGCALWNGAFVGLGWVLGSRWAIVEQYASILDYAVLGAIVGGTSWFLWRRWKVSG